MSQPAPAPAATALSWRDRLHDAFPPRRRKSMAWQAAAIVSIAGLWLLPHLVVLYEFGFFPRDPILILAGPEAAAAIEAQPELAAELDHARMVYRRVQVAGLGAIAFFVGLGIVGRLPAKASPYREWLARTPWTPDLPLPVRRFGPGLGSAAWLVVLLSLAVVSGLSAWIVIAAMAAGVGWASQDLIRLGERRWMSLLLTIALLLAMRLAFEDSLRPVAAVLAIAMGVASFILAREALWHVAWRRDLEKRWAREFRQDADSYREQGQAIPVLRIAPVPPPEPWTKLQILGASVLVGLVLSNISAAEHRMFGADPEFAGMLGYIALIGLVTLGILVRLSTWSRGRLPAFSWWMRLRNGRLLLPRSDVLWIAPLAAAPVAVVTLVTGLVAGLPIPEATGLSAAATVFVVCAIGPSRRWYRLCGGGRIAVTLPARTARPGKRRAEDSGFELEL